MHMTVSCNSSNLIQGAIRPPYLFGETMRVKILSSTVASGQNCKAGSVVDIADKDARFLIATGSAEPYIEPPKPAPKKKAPVNRVITTEQIETR